MPIGGGIMCLVHIKKSRHLKYLLFWYVIVKVQPHKTIKLNLRSLFVCNLFFIAIIIIKHHFLKNKCKNHAKTMNF